MYEAQDKIGRLVVVLPMRFRHAGKSYCIFIDGKTVAEFQTYSDAVRYARALMESEDGKPYETAG